MSEALHTNLKHTPETAISEPMHFETQGRKFAIGVFSMQDETRPNVYIPALIEMVNGSWIVRDDSNPIWDNIEEDMTYKTLAKFNVDDFNSYLMTVEGSTDTLLDYDGLLAKHFRERVTWDGSKLVIS